MGYYIYVSSLVQYCWVADELWFAADQMDTENSAIGRASMDTHATSLPILIYRQGGLKFFVQTSMEVRIMAKTTNTHKH